MTELVGIPFKDRGRTIEGFDCWGLVMHVHKEQTGETLPDFTYDLASAVSNSLYFAEQTIGPTWEETQPEFGVVAVFRIGGVIRHAGYMLDDVHFIHVLSETRVVVERIDDIMWKKRVAGFWRYVDGNS